VIVEQGQIARHTLSRPADEEGRPVARLVPPEPLPAGPFDAVLVLLQPQQADDARAEDPRAGAPA